MLTPFDIALCWHRLWVATVRYWLPTKSVRDSRAYARGPDRYSRPLPVAGQAVNYPRGDRAKQFHAANVRQFPGSK